MSGPPEGGHYEAGVPHLTAGERLPVYRFNTGRVFGRWTLAYADTGTG